MGRWLVDLAHQNGDCWGHPSIVLMVFMLLLNVCSVVLMFFSFLGHCWRDFGSQFLLDVFVHLMFLLGWGQDLF
jgi:hypothetical protein